MKYILLFKQWYELRLIREKLLVMVLGWTVLYSIFAIFLFHSLELERIELVKAAKEKNNKIETWNTQIAALNKIPNTPLYQEWLANHQVLNQLENKYKKLLNQSPTSQLQEILNTLLQSNNNITLVQIQNLPEKNFSPSTELANNDSNIYQQQFNIIIYGDYLSIYQYLQGLEKTLPNIFWQTLDYQVMQYPIAKVQMELSIIYEK